MRILLAGATGLVGGNVLAGLLADGRVDAVIAPTRRPLAAHPKLENPIVDFAKLPAGAEWWSVDGAICTLGTTRAKAGSDQAFREVDHDYPLAIARLVRDHGASRFALNSSVGADASSRFLYTRTKGQVEHAIGALSFPSLTIVRPGLISGERNEFRAAERITLAVLVALAPLLPLRWRISPAAVIANALIEAAIAGMPGVHLIEAESLSRD